MNIVICTLKSWNIEYAEKLKKKYEGIHTIKILTQKEQLINENIGEELDYIFFPHWSYIIPKEIYEKHPCVVFHMTDLPYGRGGSPLQNLIVRGFKETQISALKVEKEIDAGPIYIKKPLSLEGRAEDIYRRAAAIIFEEMIPEMIDTRPIPSEQVGEIVNFMRRTPEESEIAPNMGLEQIYDHIRMLDAEGYPNAFIRFGNKKLCFTEAQYDGEKVIANVEIVEDRECE